MRHMKKANKHIYQTIMNYIINYITEMKTKENIGMKDQDI